MTFRLFLQGLAAVGGLSGLAFLFLYFRWGLPGRSVLPRPARLLVSIALVTDSIASIVYAALVILRITIQDAPMAAGFWNRLTSAFILLAAMVPAMALLTVGVYIHFGKLGRGQGWQEKR